MMFLHGLGLVGPFGRGPEAFVRALAADALAPTADGFARIPEDALRDPDLLKNARRAGRFDRLAILAGLDALADAGRSGAEADFRTGLILATAQGPHETTFRFLDDLIRFKPEEVSPTLFSHSVHNAAASYLSLQAGLRGPTLTVTRFAFAFHEAVGLARGWLAQGRCDQVLVGVVDELGAVMEAILAARGCAHPGRTPLAEGAAFFLFRADAGGRPYAAVNWLAPGASVPAAGERYDESDGLERPGPDAPGPAWGRQACPGAFGSAAAALRLGRPELFAAGQPESGVALARDGRGEIRALEWSAVKKGSPA